MKTIATPVLIVFGSTLACFLISSGFIGGLGLASGNVPLLVLAWRNPTIAQEWQTTIIAALPIILFALACTYFFRIYKSNLFVSDGIFVWWFTHLMLLTGSFALARFYHERKAPIRA